MFVYAMAWVSPPVPARLVFDSSGEPVVARRQLLIDLGEKDKHRFVHAFTDEEGLLWTKSPRGPTLVSLAPQLECLVLLAKKEPLPDAERCKPERCASAAVERRKNEVVVEGRSVQGAGSWLTRTKKQRKSAYNAFASALRRPTVESS